MKFRKIYLLLAVLFIQSIVTAENAIEKSGLSGGICVLPEAGNYQQLAELAEHPKFLVHALTADAETVSALRQQAVKNGLLGRRLYIEKGNLHQLPYPDNLIDLIILPEGSTFPEAEILRVLAPVRGQAMIGDAILRKPALPEADDWTHRLHSASNNPVSGDTAFTGPSILQYLAMPMQTSFQGAMFVANGRRIELSDWVTKKPDRNEIAGILRARSVTNGLPLWERQLPEGIEPDMPICALHEDRIYLAASDACQVLVIDAETGKDLEPIVLNEEPDVRVNWLGIDGNRLHALIGTPLNIREKLKFIGGSNRKARQKQYQSGDTLVGWDLQSEVETFRHEEGTTIDYRTIAIHNGKSYFYAEKKRLVCLDQTGRVVWENDEDSWLKTVRRPLLLPNGNTEAVATLLVGNEQLRFAVPGGKKEYFFDAADGSFLWQRDWARLSPKSMFLDNQYITPQGAFDPATGKKNDEIDVSFLGSGCGIVTWVPGLNTGLNHVSMGVKSPCGVGAYAAGGMLSFAPSQCDCWPHVRGAAGYAPGESLLKTAKEQPQHPLVIGSGESGNTTGEPADWSVYRGSLQRTAYIKRSASQSARIQWTSTPEDPLEIPDGHGMHRDSWLERPTPAIAAGDFIYSATSKGVVEAINSESGDAAWTFTTGGAILTPPALHDGRLYAGSGDGWLYCLSSDTGALIWKWRGAPVDRRVVVYGKLTSLWPVTSVIVSEQGKVFGVAGQNMQNGSVTFSLDAVTGEPNWTTWTEPWNEPRRLLARADFGFGPAGDMTLMGEGKHLVIRTYLGIPAVFDTDSGQRIPPSSDYQSLANDAWSLGFRTSTSGQDLCVLDKNRILQGGYPVLGNPDIRHDKSAAKFVGWQIDDNGHVQADPLPWWAIPHSMISPAFDDQYIALVGGVGKSGRSENPTIGLSFWSREAWEKEINNVPDTEPEDTDPNIPKYRAAKLALAAKIKKYNTSLNMEKAAWRLNELDVSALALTSNAVIAAYGERKGPIRGTPVFTGWKLAALSRESGEEIWSLSLPGEPIVNGLTASGDGWLVSMRDGGVVKIGE